MQVSPSCKSLLADSVICNESLSSPNLTAEPIPSRFKGVCSLNNKLYVVGGSDPCGQKGLKNCDAFDPVTKTWANCASLNISMCPYNPT